VAENGGDRGDWSVVRSRKKKATQPEDQRRDRSRVSERHGGLVQHRGNAQRSYGTDGREVRRSTRASREQHDTNFLFDGKKGWDVDRRGTTDGKVREFIHEERNKGSKLTFYFANIPDFMPLFRLRQYFEVCGILSDVYVARQLNSRGQVYGFVRFMNVRNKDKLTQALNNVWIGDFRVWAREARFDRFAQYDVDSRVPYHGGRRSEIGEEVRPVVITLQEGVRNVRVSKEKAEGKKPEGEKKVTIGEVEVVVGKKSKKKKKLKSKNNGGNDGAAGKVKNTAVEGRKIWELKSLVVEKENIVQTKEPASKNVLVYNSRSEDRGWANGGLVATVVSGDSTLSPQQRVEDAGFDNVVVTPMGSDKVFLHCSRGGDMWQVIQEALDFFSMLFSDIHKWTKHDEIYERGAWLRVYGTPIHTWNEVFFKLCVADCGRFIRSDECTVDKARLDFARILISTTFLEVVNVTSEFLVDDCKYSIKLVEEWGCNLGEDAFMTEEELENKAETCSIRNEVPEMDNLVDELSKDWQANVDQNNNFFNVDIGLQPEDQVYKAKAASVSSEQHGNSKDKLISMNSASVSNDQQASVLSKQQGNSPGKQHFTVNSATVFHEHRGNDYGNLRNLASGPVSEQQCNNSERKQVSTKRAQTKTKSSSKSQKSKKRNKKAGAVLKQSAGFIKKIARMPVKERREILKVLKKQECKRSVLSKTSKAMGNSFSISSNSSNSSVNKDWENWIVIHGKKEIAAGDVREIRRRLGVSFNGDINNCLNLLTREGRKELRAERGVVLMEGDKEDGGGRREGC